jgi:hypothetical protein
MARTRGEPMPKERLENIAKDAADFDDRVESLKRLLTPEQVLRIRNTYDDQIREKITSKKRFVLVVYHSSQSLLRWIDGKNLKEWDKPLQIDSMSLDEAWDQVIVARNMINVCCNTPGTFVLCVASHLPMQQFYTDVLGGAPNPNIKDGISTYTSTVLRF